MYVYQNYLDVFHMCCGISGVPAIAYGNDIFFLLSKIATINFRLGKFMIAIRKSHINTRTQPQFTT